MVELKLGKLDKLEKEEDKQAGCAPGRGRLTSDLLSQPAPFYTQIGKNICVCIVPVLLKTKIIDFLCGW